MPCSDYYTNISLEQQLASVMDWCNAVWELQLARVMYDALALMYGTVHHREELLAWCIPLETEQPGDTAGGCFLRFLASNLCFTSLHADLHSWQVRDVGSLACRWCLWALAHLASSKTYLGGKAFLLWLPSASCCHATLSTEKLMDSHPRSWGK